MSLRRRALVRLATSAAFERSVTLAPSVRARAWRSARRYVAGEAPADAVAVAQRLAKAGLGASIDLFGERTAPEEAPAVARRYEELCALIAAATDERTWISLDLPNLAFDPASLDVVASAVPPGRRL